MRAEALDAMGDPAAVAAYRTAALAADEPMSHNLRAKGALAMIKQGNPKGALEELVGVRPNSVDGRLCEALTYCGAAALGGAAACGHGGAASAGVAFHDRGGESRAGGAGCDRVEPAVQQREALHPLRCQPQAQLHWQQALPGIALLDHPQARLVKLAEEHGFVDVSACAEPPAVGDVVRGERAVGAGVPPDVRPTLPLGAEDALPGDALAHVQAEAAALFAATVEALDQLGWLDDAQRESLKPWRAQVLLNVAGVPVGERRSQFKMSL